MRSVIAIAALTACCGSWGTDEFNYYDAGKCSAYSAYVKGCTTRSTAIKQEAKRQGSRQVSKEEIWESGRIFGKGFEIAVAWLAQNNFDRKYEKANQGIVETDCYRFASG